MVWPKLAFPSFYQFFVGSYLRFISKILKNFWFNADMIWDITSYLNIFYKFLIKAHMVWCTYCLKKYLTSSNQDTIRLEGYWPLKVLFLYFKISLTIKSHGQYGLTRIVHLDQFNQSLSKMVWFALYLQTFSVNSDRDTVTLEQYYSLKYPRQSSVKSFFVTPWNVFDKFVSRDNTVWPILFF